MTQTAADTAPAHRWRFFRAGGFDQLRLDSAADLRGLLSLDQKLWLALACPTGSVEFDRRTLALIDRDGDGRIRAPELLAAVDWTLRMLTDAEACFAGHDALPLALIDASHPEGAALLASAKRILANLGKPGSPAVTAEEAADVQRLFASTRLNGDGIVPPSAAEDEATAAAMRRIMAVTGSRPDRGGEEGMGEEELQAFFTAAEAWLAWCDEAAAKPEILPLGDATLAAAEAMTAVAAKIDDYFFRCRLAAFDPAAGPALNADAEDFAAIADSDLSDGAPPVVNFPLARIEADRSLPLPAPGSSSAGQGGVNPAWAEALGRFRDAVVVPLLGARASLTEAEWRQLQAKLKPCLDWQARKAGMQVEGVAENDLRSMTTDGTRERIAALIAADMALAPEFEAVAGVEKLARYLRDLVPLLNNFVAFRDFYTRRAKAIFQIGTLYIDGRSCDLCIRVDDPAKHATLATLSRIYLLYCDCVRRGSNEKMTIAVGVTAGDADQLMVGRNGVFYDRLGADWDAVVTKIVSHPISIREAFWMPFRKAGKFIGDQIEKFAAARGKASEAQMQAQLVQAGTAAATGAKPAAPPPPAFDAGKFAGIFAAIGLAIGAIGTALASVMAGLLNLSWWQIPLAVGGVILLISGPSMVIAAMKLRQRNLGPILDANGWAVNARARINLPFGASLTQLAKLPPGAERALTDPYAEKRTPWRLYAVLVILVVAVLVAWHRGWLDGWLPGWLGG